MVFALYGLAALMVAGGLWSVVQGLDYVVLERGWTMVIAGSVLATGGLLLFGIARAVAVLGRIEANLLRGIDRMARAGMPDAPPPRPNLAALGTLTPDPSPTLPPLPQPSTPGAATAGATGLAAGLGVAGLAGSLGRGEDGAPPPPGQDPPLADAPDRSDPLLADAPERLDPPLADAPAPPSPRAEAADEFGFAGLLRGTHDDAKPEEPAEEPRTAVHFAEPVVPDPEGGPGEAPREPSEDPDAASTGDAEASSEDMAVIGTYSSGGNTYTMYSDGSIEAETPGGRFHFASLEELKEFIAAGGEAPAGGTRA